ncbi:hypothetical protein PR202_gb18253 [Eleusine coracana subsp. coracana]|uniref:Uncharacterized protein n=1 Tax=Eleusine coracana subsp. coracana TaxID=191504 RepID=A0AAV5F557_ELECO|nr:hypothetical protein PR202_gb18253 [Eleusine coracana subsp. coracana]
MAERAVAALQSCFGALPADAVPAVVDCVLDSSETSPSQLFHALVGSSVSKEQQVQNLHAAISQAAALCHLLARFDRLSKIKDALRLLLWRVFLPLLRDRIQQNHSLLHQVVELMCDAAANTGSWDLLGATIVPFCIQSTASAMDSSASHDSMLYHTTMQVDFARDNVSRFLSLSQASSVLASLLGETLKRRTILTAQGGAAAADLDVLVQNLTWDLSTLALKMFSHSQEYRSCAARILLQPILISLADVSCVTVMFGTVQHKLSRSGFLEQIWNSCISLFSMGRGEKLDAYTILSLYFSTLKLGHQNTVLRADEVQEFDLRNVSKFWNELRSGLVDKDSLLRKHAFYVLKISLSIFTTYPVNDGTQHCSSRSSAALPAQNKSSTGATKRERWANKEAKSLGVKEVGQSGEDCSSGQDRWKVFLLLYEMLQEYGTHLVEAAWAHQVLMLFESTPENNYLSHTSHGAFYAQMESLEGILLWMAVLWERGFNHDNPQVRCLVMQSFLDIAWDRYESDTSDAPCVTSEKEVEKCDGDAPTEVKTVDLLDVLCILSERTKQHFNPKYRLKGPLRVIVQKWLLQNKECSIGNTLLNKLIDFPTTFVKGKQEEGSNLFDDEDVGAWEAEAQRWSRTLLLVMSEEQHVTRIFVRERGAQGEKKRRKEREGERENPSIT